MFCRVSLNPKTKKWIGCATRADSVAQCVARVAINELNKLPDAMSEDMYWTLSQLVNRRANLKTHHIRLKNQLHEQVCVAYPSYKQFFQDIGRPTALYFWEHYPSPRLLRGKTVGELYRIGASKPIEWIDPETGEIMSAKETPQQEACRKIMESDAEDKEEQLKEYGCRMKFPAKSGNLMTRWCSPYLKIDVAATVLRNLETVKENSKVLICSGERRGESKGRSKYNEMEIYFRANAEKKLKRTVHQWRPVIDYSEKDVWEVLKRNRVNPHPCYRAGWNRCSCAGCIFSTPELFAGFKELYPAEFEEMKHDEKALGFTLDNKCDLETYIEGAKPCLYKGDKEAIHSLITGIFTESDIFIDGVWKYPAGAFHGAEGGPC